MRAIVPLLLFVLAGCEQKIVLQDYDRDPATQSFIDEARIPEIRKMATQACLCKRKNGPDSEAKCWGDFWKEVNEYKQDGGVASACGPGSVAYFEFTRKSGLADSDGRMTVHTEWSYGACSGAEIKQRKAEYERQSKRRGC